MEHADAGDHAAALGIFEEAELDAIGEHDPYVDEELALLDPPSVS